MARTKIKVDETLLRKIIAEKESNNKYTARSALYNDVASSYNEQSNIKINGQIVYLRVGELNIDLKTPVGKRGRAAGCVINTGVKVPRAEKLAKSSDAQKTFEALRKELKVKYDSKHDNTRFLPLVQKMQDGSLKAATKLMCLSCANYSTQEVAMCEILSCPLHPFRPYKGKSNNLTKDESGV